MKRASNLILRIVRRVNKKKYGEMAIAQIRIYYKVLFSKYFDAKWYREHYDCQHMDPCKHYLTIGWKKLYNPSSRFSTVRYLIQNPDVRRAGMNPLVHYLLYGVNEPHRECHTPLLAVGLTKEKLEKFKKIQDKRIGKEYRKDIEKLVVYLVPDFDQICGGMMCITNYPNDIKNEPEVKGYSFMLATIPSTNTFSDYTKFDAHAHVYRFEQIRTHFKHLKKLIIHIPEYQFINTLYNMSCDDLAWLSSFDDVTINLMNQNQELMPEPGFVEMFKKIVPNFTMTCAHEQYCNKNIQATYKMPLHYIPADKKIKFYNVPFEEKEDILVLSPDPHPAKDGIVAKIEKAFPHMKIIIVENMAFQEYLELIGKAKWVISFGEGFDGYTIESILSGTISFTLYNDIFFKTDFVPWPNMFENSSRMSENIVNVMLENDNVINYNRFLREIQKLCNAEFSGHHYEERLKAYYQGEFSLPYNKDTKCQICDNRMKPLVSVIVPFNRDDEYLKKQLESIDEQTYENIEVLLCPYGRTTTANDTVKEFMSNKQHFSLLEKEDTYNKATEKLIFKSSGEYIAISDDKDIWSLNKIEQLLDVIDGFDISYCSTRYINSKGEDISGSRYVRQPLNNCARWYQLQDMLVYNPVLGSTMLLRTEFIKNNMPGEIDSIVTFAWWFMLKTSISGAGAVYVGADLTQFRETKENYLLDLISEKTFLQKQWNMFNYLLLTSKEILSKKNYKIISLHMNWLKLQQALSACELNNTEDFMNTNHYAFTKETLTRLEQMLIKINETENA